jgi:Leucine-rich repeat (LRR) protein
LSRNFIANIDSAKLSSLVRLKSLDLSRNKLTSIPEDLTKLPLLSILIMNRNDIEVLPQDMSGMRNLRTLDLSHNKLIRTGTVLDDLPSLSDLNLSDNPTLDLIGMSIKSRRLHEKLQLLRNKSTRRILIKRALGIRQEVLNKEQAYIESEVTLAKTKNLVNNFP